MAQQTAVEWLFRKIYFEGLDDKFVKEAKEIEKQQIIDAFYDSELHNTGNENDGEIYYNYTYENNL